MTAWIKISIGNMRGRKEEEEEENVNILVHVIHVCAQEEMATYIQYSLVLRVVLRWGKGMCYMRNIPMLGCVTYQT